MRIIRAIAYLSMIVLVLCAVDLRFSHPTLTETQLFMVFWREWLLIALGFVVALWSLNSE